LASFYSLSLLQTSDPDLDTQLDPVTRRPMRPAWLAMWAAADKALPMLYGLAMIVVAFRVLDAGEKGVWAIYQTVFMIISLLAEFFILQPMVKLASERASERGPIITASIALYTGFSLLLALVVVAIPTLLSTVLKSPGAATLFGTMLLLVATTVVRNIAIRILQIDYRIVAIFIVDLAYFAPLVALMVLGAADGTFDIAMDMVDYNLIAFSVSSVVGAIATHRDLLPHLHGIGASTRRVLDLGVHQGGTGVLTVTQQQVDIPIVSGMKGQTLAGIYFTAKTFYRFFDAVRDAAQLLLVPATSRAYAEERIEAVEEVTEFATAALVALIFPITIGLIATAPWLVPIAVHEPAAIDEFQWLMANGFAMPFVIVPSAVLLGIGRTRDLFRGTFIGTVAMVASGSVLTWFFGATGMAAGVLAGSIVTAILLTRRMNRYVPFTFGSVLRRSRSFGSILRKWFLRGRR
jgi:O-antigen/teichoic acid export membrane protein